MKFAIVEACKENRLGMKGKKVRKRGSEEVGKCNRAEVQKSKRSGWGHVRSVDFILLSMENAQPIAPVIMTTPITKTICAIL
jgi:hypothetical protein